MWLGTMGAGALGMNEQAAIDTLTAQVAQLQAELAGLRAGPAPSVAEKYQALCGMMDAGFCLIEMKFGADGQPLDYKFLETNQAFERHTGLRHPEGLWIRDIVPDHDQHWFDVYGRVASSGEPVRFVERADALDRVYEVHAMAIGPAGRRQVAVLFNDISAHRNAERALAQNEGHWRGLFERLNDGFILAELVRDAAGVAVDWRYLDVNPAWARLVGLDAEQSKGKTLYALFPGIERCWVEDAVAVIESGRAVSFQRQIGALGRWYEGRISHLADDRFTVIFQEITEARRSQVRRQGLLELSDSLREVDDPAQVPHIAAQKIREVLEADNALYVEGGEPAGPSAAGAIVAIPFGDREPLAAIYIASAEPREWGAEDLAFAREAAARAANAMGRRQAEAELRRINTYQEELIQARTDELLKSEEQLRQSQKMEAVGQLTGGIAHDFNNLLTGISGSLELLQARVTQGRVNELDRYLNAAMGAAKRAASLTHRLLAFSRRQTLDPQPTDVARLLVGIEELIGRTVGPEIHTRMFAAPGTWATFIDPNQLENALLNLCINARDAMPGGGELIVEASNLEVGPALAARMELPVGQYVSVCVSDNGQGMPEAVVQRAFEPFFTTKPLGMGTGLGLSMIYGFVRQSGGQARIHSVVGEGSTVCLYLPRHHGELGTAAAPPAEAMPRAVDGETVLVVDDEPTVRVLVTEILEELGYRAIEAADGASGLSILQSNVRIDLVVSDVGLPGGMNGRQMADAARLSRPGLKILFITGYAESSVIGRDRLDANMHVMTKPFSVDALAVRIRGLIETGG
ncbi:ATP-binding protein [Pseudomonas sp. NPDC007930]|uniref:ATP-binding protein n=1 Tax=Pseudomonas sp. NPDC007930 TaxID=3364417 RepID=UPI0036E853AD